MLGAGERGLGVMDLALPAWGLVRRGGRALAGVMAPRLLATRFERRVAGLGLRACAPARGRPGIIATPKLIPATTELVPSRTLRVLARRPRAILIPRPVLTLSGRSGLGACRRRPFRRHLRFTAHRALLTQRQMAAAYRLACLGRGLGGGIVFDAQDLAPRFIR